MKIDKLLNYLPEAVWWANLVSKALELSGSGGKLLIGSSPNLGPSPNLGAENDRKFTDPGKKKIIKVWWFLHVF